MTKKFLQIRGWKRKLLLVALLVSICLSLITSPEPSIQATAPVTPDQARTARTLLQDLRHQALTRDQVDLVLGNTELAALSGLASQRTAPARVWMEVSDGRLTIRISQPLPVRWLNISLTTHRLADDPLQARATIGSLPLSPWLTRQTLALGLRVKGSDFNQLVQAVESAEITDNRLHARIRMPEGQAFLQQLSSAQIAIDPAQVRKIYCALTSEQLQSPDDLLATQLKRAVSGSGASAEQHGAALVALGMLVIDPRIGELANVQLSTVKVCRIAPIQATLAGRQDLAKHWTMSAVLLVTTNDDLAEATGVWKELSDTGTEKSRKQMRNTTGFSFVDIAADRSGLLVAKGLLDPERLSRTREQVMMVTDEQLLPTRAATLHEGLNDAQFQQLYGNAQDPRYLAKLGLIDRLLAAHWK